MIKQAMFEMAPQKSLGPDGFPTGFLPKILEHDRTQCMQLCSSPEERSNSASDEEVNYTDTCLIPKVTIPQMVNQFRPITVCNIIYKVLSKTFVNRLKIINKIISLYQTGFISDRSIQDNIVVAQETVHRMNRCRGKSGYFVMKVDLAKAYDMMNQSFASKVLMEIGIPNKLRQVIMNSITTENIYFMEGSERWLFRHQKKI